MLISADVHGNLEDFARLREIFLASCAAGEQPLWISVGDWVHGPAPERDAITDGEGQPLYAYPDETPELLDQYFALMDRYPDQVLSICGNHEHAHIGGMRTRQVPPRRGGGAGGAADASADRREAPPALRGVADGDPTRGVRRGHHARRRGTAGTALEYERIAYAGGQRSAQHRASCARR